jgi:hypothetical protein
MKWLILIGVVVFGIIILIFTIALRPFSAEIANQSIIMANETLGANVVASNYSYFGPMMRMLSWFGIFLVAGFLFFVGYKIIKK